MIGPLPLLTVSDSREGRLGRINQGCLPHSGIPRYTVQKMGSITRRNDFTPLNEQVFQLCKYEYLSSPYVHVLCIACLSSLYAVYVRSTVVSLEWFLSTSRWV